MKNLILFFGTLISVSAFSQNNYMKFGKVPIEDIQMTTYIDDTSAAAVVLDEWGYTYLSAGYSIITEQHIRIKILKPSAFKKGNLEFRIHKNQLFSKFSAGVYNFTNGEVIEREYGKKDFDVKSDDGGYFIYSLAMEDVKVGSVIEYAYNKEMGDYNNFISWYFQGEYPVRKSVFYAQWYEIVPYKSFIEGYETVTTEQSTITYSGLKATLTRYEANNVPAIIEEPYTNNFENEITKVHFEIEGVYIPGRLQKNFNTSYEKIISNLLKDENVGGRIYTPNINDIIDKTADELSKAQSVFSWIQNNISWNGTSNIYCSFPLWEAKKNGIGSSADINLLLVSMLRAANIDCHPVVISTRGHGPVNPYNPSMKIFNYIIVYTKIGEKEYLLDATEPFIQFGQLPERCMNGSGLILIPNNTIWIPLLRDESEDKKFMIDLQFNENNKLIGTIKSEYNSYRAYTTRKSISKDGIEKFTRDFIEDHTSIISDMSIENADNSNQPLKINYSIEVNDNAEILGNRINFKPLVINRTKANPLKSENRKYAVDFATPFSETYVINVTIPDGYTVENIPEPTRVSLPEKAGSIMFSIRAINNKLSIIYKLSVKQPVFYNNQYQEIRSFFDYIVKAENTSIMLKKVE